MQYLASVFNDGTDIASIVSSGIAAPYATGISLVERILAATLTTSSCYNAITFNVYKVSNTMLTIVLLALPVTFTWPLGIL